MHPIIIKVKLAILILFCAINSIAQCPDFPFNITSQTQIDSFIIKYPFCTKIGLILINTNDSIHNLNGLSQITEIGTLSIQNTKGLTSLKGLHNVTKLRNIRLLNNLDLIHLDDLSDSIRILDNLIIKRNSKLQKLNRFIHLDSITNEFSLSDFNGTDSISFINTVKFINQISLNNINNFNTKIIRNGGRINSISIHHCKAEEILSINIGQISPITVIVSNFDSKINEIRIKTDSVKVISYSENEADSLILDIKSLYIYRFNFYGNKNIGKLRLLPEGEIMINEFDLDYNSILKTVTTNHLYKIANLHATYNKALESIDFLSSNETMESIYLENNKLSLCEIKSLCFSPKLRFAVISNLGSCKTLYDFYNNCGQLRKNPVGNFVFENQEDIISIQKTFPNADTIFGYITIQSSKIKNMSYFRQIKRMSSIFLRNLNLVSLDDLNGLNVRNIEIYNLPELTEINFSKMPDTLGYISIRSCPKLTKLNAFQNLKALYNLDLHYLALKNLNNFQHLNSVQTMEFSLLNDIDTIQFSNIYNLYAFKISNCSNLKKVVASSEESDMETLSIINNEKLEEIQYKFPNLYRCSLFEVSNNKCKKIIGLENLNSINTISISYLSIDLDFLPSLQSAYSISLSNNYSKKFKFDSLENVSKLVIEDNYNLNSIEAKRLRYIDNGLTIQNNYVLPSIENFNCTLRGASKIINNPQLAMCNSNMICDALKNAVPLEINLNKSTCSLESINQYCLVNIENEIMPNLLLYPNPALDYLYFKNLENISVLTYELYSDQGNKLMAGKLKSELDISNLPNGIFVVKVHNNYGSKRLKFLKI